MIGHSDNTATDILLNLVGADNVRSLLDRLNMDNTHIPDSVKLAFQNFEKGETNNIVVALSTVNEMVLFYEQVQDIYTSETTYNLFKSIMQEGERNNSFPWPEGVHCYRKGGLLHLPNIVRSGVSGRCEHAGESIVFSVYFSYGYNGDEDLTCRMTETGTRVGKMFQYIAQQITTKANQKLQPTVKKPVESGNEQGIAAEL